MAAARDSAQGLLPADQAAELAIVILLVFDDAVQDGQAGRIAELFELLAVLGDVAALIDLQAAQGQVVAPDAGLEAVSITARASPVDRLRLPQFTQAAGPQCGVLLFRQGHVFESLLTHRLGLPLGESPIGVIARHLGLPVLFQNLA